MSERFISAFQSPKVNKLFVVATLHLTRIYQITKVQFERKYRTDREQSIRKSGNRLNQSESFKESIRLQSKTIPPERKQGEQMQWQSLEFPQLRPILRYYELLSTCYMVWILIRNSMPDFLQRVIGWLGPPMPPSCYLLGHLVLHDAISRQLGILVCTIHVCWRLIEHYSKRPFWFSLFTFLSMSDTDLKRFIQLLDQQNRKRTRPDACNWKIIESDPSKSIKLDGLLKDTLCFKVQHDGILSYRLKPNRTPEALVQLRRRAAQTAYYGCIFFAILVSLNLPNCLIQIFNDKRYLRVHPGCDAHVERMKNEGRITSWSVSWGRHQTLSFTIDIIESLIVWIDSGLSTISAWVLVYLLNYDNLFYWKHLDQHLKQLYGRVRADFESRQVGALNICNSLRLRSRFAIAKLQALDDEIFKLHTEFFDFFHQIGQTDLIVSDVVTNTVAFWLASSTVLGHFALCATFDQKLVATMVGYILALAFVIVTAGSFSLLTLHNNCIKSYQTLCSMMAYDHPQNKEGYPKVIDFFTEQKRSIYTLCQQYHYTKTTYLSIFGWALTCFLIFHDMFV